MTTAATRNVSAFRYSARSTWSTPGMTSDRRPPTVVSSANTMDASHRGEPVGGDQAELVGRLQLVPAEHVRDGGLLGRDPEQGERLDQELGHEQPDQVVDDRDRGEQAEPDDVDDHHRLAAVEAVGEGTRERSQHDGREQAEQQDAAEGEVGRREPAHQRRRGGGDRQEPEPVAEARQRHRHPQPAEVADPQDRAQLGHQPDRPQRAVRRPVTARDVVHRRQRRTRRLRVHRVTGRRRRWRRVGRNRDSQGSGVGRCAPRRASRYRSGPTAPEHFRLE